MNRIVSTSRNNTRTESSIIRDRSFILSDKTAFSVNEEYKTLRTNIMFSVPSEDCKLIGITSARSMEGKSISCLNLAITAAQTNARVLLIDCDLRLPKAARLLDMDAIPGISNVLVGLSTIKDAIKQTQYTGLEVLLSGDIPPNPSELLGSENMKKLLDELRTSYDYIFIDLPPVNIVSDAAIMSKFLSGEVIVVRAGLSDRENVLKAINQLKFVDATILGLVLNGIQSTAGGRYGKYGKYGKYKEYSKYDGYSNCKETESLAKK